MKKTLCIKCNNYFSDKAGNYKKHFLVCDGTYRNVSDKGNCIYCSIKFVLHDKPSGWMANHVRWCDKNPKKNFYKNRDISQLNTPEARKKASDKIKQAWKSGKYDHIEHNSFLGRTHTEETKKILKDKALNSKHRRLVRSIRPYTKIDGSIIMLDSSWEEALAIRLDAPGIDWTRPETPIRYIGLDGLTHNYFPDFYLPKYDLFLDPKNPIAYKVQKEKIDILKNVLHNLVIIHSLEECKNFTI